MQIWVLLGSLLSIVLYLGLCLEENTLSDQQTKTLINKKKSQRHVWITSKLLDLSLNFVVTIVLAWGLALGDDEGHMFAGSSQFFIEDLNKLAGGMSLIFFLFTVTSISSLIVAENIRHELDPLHVPYQAFVLISVGVVFPIVVHWTWSDSGWASPWRSSDERALLFGCGTLDTGGSGVVHLAAGLVSLAFSAALSYSITHKEPSLYLEEPLSSEGLEMKAFASEEGVHKHVRIHDHSDGERANDESSSHHKLRLRNVSSIRSTISHLHGHNEIKQELGSQESNWRGGSALLIWLGNYGMCIVCNLPGELETNLANDSSVNRRLLNVTLAVACSFLLSILIEKTRETLDKRTKTNEIADSLDMHLGSVLCALVAVKAGCGVMELEGAVVVGLLACFTFRLSSRVHWGSVHSAANSAIMANAATVHLTGGLLGLLSVGFFASPEGYAESITSPLGLASPMYTTYDTATYQIDVTSKNRAISCAGIFYGGNGNLLGANCLLILALLSWCFLLMFIVATVLATHFKAEFASLRDESLFKSAPYAADEEGAHPIQTTAIFESKAKTSAESNTIQCVEVPLTEVTVNKAKISNSESAEEPLKSTAKGKTETSAITPPLNQFNKRTDRSHFALDSLRKQLSKSIKLEVQVPEYMKSFKEEFGYDWDAVIVFPIHPDIISPDVAKKIELRASTKEKVVDDGFVTPVTCGKHLPSAKRLVQVLREAGCETYQYYSVNHDKIICKIRVPLLVLRRYADLLNMRFLLDETMLRKMALAGYESSEGGKHVRIAPFDIYDGFAEGVTSLRPYQYIYGAWKAGVKLDLFERAFGCKHEFGSLQRLQIINLLVRGAIDDAEDMDSFDELSSPAKSAILAWFPLHNREDKEYLKKAVFDMTILPGKEPADACRNYFGEELGLYFKFLAHYTKWLLSVGIFGIAWAFYMAIQWCLGTTYYNLLNRSIWPGIFGIFVCIWSFAMLKYWADHERLYALRWGTSDFEEEEKELPAYEGILKPSFVNGSLMKVVDMKSQRSRRRVSLLIIFVLSCLVICCFGCTFYLKFWLISHNLQQYSAIADILNSILIAVLDNLYKNVAIKMTAYENCRTQTEFNDSLITKLFLFGFCNTYAPIIYIAFVKKLVGDPCLRDSCMGELSQSLAIIFSSKPLTAHLSAYFLPKLKLHFAKCMFKWHKVAGHPTDQTPQDTKKKMCKIEIELLKEPYGANDVFTEYNEVSVQFGFLTMFVTAFPVAPFMAMVSNFIEDRIDGLKLLNDYRRSWPKPAEDIGSWYDIFSLISILSVFVNGAIVFWTMDTFDDRTDWERVYFFIFFCVIAFAGRYLVVVYSTNPRSEEVALQQARQKHLIRKLIDRVPDDLDFDKELAYIPDVEYYMHNKTHQCLTDKTSFLVTNHDEEL